jgi:hypothetical protein
MRDPVIQESVFVGLFPISTLTCKQGKKKKKTRREKERENENWLVFGWKSFFIPLDERHSGLESLACHCSLHSAGETTTVSSV